MKRLILHFLAAVSLLLGVSAAIGSQAAPAQADTTIPLYGCPATLDGSPIGGGVGCTMTYSSADVGTGDYQVSTLAGLKSALAAVSSGHKVFISDNAVILVSSLPGKYGNVQGFDCMFYVPSGVTLCAGRGRNGVTGGKIQVDASIGEGWYTLFGCGAGAKVHGLTIQGTSSSTDARYNWSGVLLGNNGEVYNCEIYNFPDWGVCIWQGMTGWVHHNNIHHCRRLGSGYGVNTGAMDIYHTCTALVEGNVLDYCRHVIAGQDGLLDYTFRYNYLGANAAYEGQIDSHGNNDGGTNDLDKDGNEYIYCAGRNLQIYNNTSECIIQNGMDEFVVIRGTPHSTGLVSVHNNWLKAPGRSANNIIQFMFRIPQYGYDAPSGGPYVRMDQHDNWYGTTAPPSTNRAPVLNAVGSKTVVELATLAFTISATDPDGDTLTYSASNLPQGATFQPATRTFSWTPGSGQSGTYTNVHFQVSDGKLTDSEDITISVTAGSSLQGDVNGDGAVNALDMIRVGQHWGETGVGGWIREDINQDGTVNVLDATLVGQHWTG